jgi:hypothetical protein
MNPTLFKLLTVVIGTVLGILYDLQRWKGNPDNKNKPYDFGAAWPRYATGFVLGVAAAFGMPTNETGATATASALPAMLVVRRPLVVCPKMKRSFGFLTIVLGTLVLSPIARARVAVQTSTWYDLKSGAQLGLTTPPKSLEHFLGTKYTAKLSAYTGSSIAGIPSAGLILGGDFKAWDGGFVSLGIAGGWTQNQKLAGRLFRLIQSLLGRTCLGFRSDSNRLYPNEYPKTTIRNLDQIWRRISRRIIDKLRFILTDLDIYGARSFVCSNAGIVEVSENPGQTDENYRQELYEYIDHIRASKAAQ